MNHRAIAVFAKAPVPGQVKTRLIGVLTPTQAAAIHARLTVETIRLVTVKDWGREQGVGFRDAVNPSLGARKRPSRPFSPSNQPPAPPVVLSCFGVNKSFTRVTAKAPSPIVYLYCHPDTNHPFFQILSRRFPITLRSQRGDNLGQRMANALDECLNRHQQVILLGCDCPSLTPADLQTAFQSLTQGCDVVLGPAEDGGYVLIGITRLLPFLFEDMAWGGAEVLAATLERLRKEQIPFQLLPMQWDLDRPDDLERYRRLRSA